MALKEDQENYPYGEADKDFPQSFPFDAPLEEFPQQEGVYAICENDPVRSNRWILLIGITLRGGKTDGLRGEMEWMRSFDHVVKTGTPDSVLFRTFTIGDLQPGEAIPRKFFDLQSLCQELQRKWNPPFNHGYWSRPWPS